MTTTETTVWAAEKFTGSWKVVRGGLTREEAIDLATELAQGGEEMSIAEYTTDEGSSAISREEFPHVCRADQLRIAQAVSGYDHDYEEIRGDAAVIAARAGVQESDVIAYCELHS